MSVCYAGPFLDASGYGEASRNAIQALVVAGADICTQKVVFTNVSSPNNLLAKSAEELSERKIDYKIKIIHTTPDIYKNYIERGKYNIGHLFWETTSLPKSWVAPCNLMDEIWTGTELNKKTIQDSGVTVPVRIFPQSINIDIPSVKPYKISNFDGFLFYSIFDWKERKNPKALLNAFWKEFKGSKDVALLIKTGNYPQQEVEQIIHEAKLWKNELGFKDTPRVFFCTNILTDIEKHRIHETGDCFVSAHRGEGWGLSQVEATLHSKPVISVGFGGVHEYWRARNYKAVNFSLVPIKQIYNKYYEPGMKWAEVDESDLQEKMRKIYESWLPIKTRKLLKARATPSRNMTVSSFNYKIIGRMMLDRLSEIEATL